LKKEEKMMVKNNKSIVIFGILALMSVSLFLSQVAAPGFALPITGASVPQAAAPATQLKAGGSQVASVTVTEKFSYSVVQSGNSAPSGGVLGQYAYASQKGSLGFIAHNYAAGHSFFALEMGDTVTVTYNNGKRETFKVVNALRYQATDPNDFSAPFLNGNGKELSAIKVFKQAYRKNWVTFQTCISQDGTSTWGLLFVQAKPE
jgi:hypothetical protein